jgi:hypothetical protein
MRAILAVLLLCAPALAEPPPVEVLAGGYGVVGRDDARPPRLVDGWLRLDPEGAGLAVTGCDGPAGRLDFASMFEAENYLTGRIGRWEIWCMFAIDADNYPMLNCATEDGVRVTLWPDGGTADAPPACGKDAGTPVGR